MDFRLPLTETTLKRTMINGLIIGLSACMFVACSDKSTSTNVAYMEAVNSEACSTPWDGTAVYNVGETVSSSGRNYTAVLWTQRQDPTVNNGPSGSGQPWRVVSVCASPPESTARLTLPKNPSASL